MADVDLFKRTPGTPLSEAELQQRKEAARSRWAAVGAGLAGAAAAGAVVNTQVRRRQHTAWAEMRRAKVETVGAEVKRNERVVARMDAVRAAADKRISRGWVVPLQRQVLAHDAQTAQRTLRRLPSEFINFDTGGREIYAPLDQDEAGRLRGKIAGARADIDALQDARAPQRVARKATTVKVPKAHTRKIKVKVKVEGASPQLARAQNRLDEARQVLRELEASSTDVWDPALQEAERSVSHAERAAGRAGGARTTTKTIEVGAKRGEEGAARDAFRRAGSARMQGTPDDKALARMRQQLRARVRDTHNARLFREFTRHREQLGAAKTAARTRWATTLARLPNRRVRIAAIGLGALAGGALTGLGTYAIDRPRRVEKLAKFAEDSARDPAEELLAAGDDAEATLGERLAAVFRSWRDAPAAQLLQPGADLMAEVQRGLRHATEPLIEAMSRGAATPPASRGVIPDEAMALAFSFDARNPRVANYIREYREQRVREMAEEQTDTIRDTVFQAALTGAPPAEIARQIRQSIGLTAAQAAQVRTFRAQLEALDQRAMGRALRDKRFDRTVVKAIEADEALSGEQVDKMVDAYHRRYLAYRAMTIARTEGVGAANNGHVAALKEWLVENPNYTVVKTWMATKDERTRPDHVALHGQEVTGIDTQFRCESGDMIRWPGDQDASARQTINCRCTILSKIVPRDQLLDLSAYGGVRE